MIAFIDAHRDQFGVELICGVLRAAFTGFLTFRGDRAAKARPPSDRAIGDELLIADLRIVHEEKFSVCGVKMMHHAMRRRGWSIGRKQIPRLMRTACLRVVQRGKPVFTTISDPADCRPADLVDRPFSAPAPHRLWVAPISTLVRAWQGFCYSAFVTDACTKAIVGWAVAATMRIEDLPLQEANHAVWQIDSNLWGWSIIPTAEPNTYRSPIPTGWPNSGSRPR
ncbi:IS3 family transposase [Mycobacterium sp. MYCO198283]|uniref:IS3 family transposase n=1 Tax=Mycobacterium sp. MYCO198283 TaxID=2883505 RepID=UPI001E52398F|nr:IS3 family transposase [Mycobacterium sp. MYCO198283]MCG5432752.1 IS3 family transposase [Mycobacterium sp. MYCO198283]